MANISICALVLRYTVNERAVFQVNFVFLIVFFKERTFENGLDKRMVFW